MATGRINRKVLDHIAQINKENKAASLVKNYTSNSALNDLLNETAQGDTNTQSGNAPVNLSQPFATGAPLPTDTTGMTEGVANAVTRDYSDLMKHINNKKRN